MSQQKEGRGEGGGGEREREGGRKEGWGGRDLDRDRMEDGYYRVDLRDGEGRRDDSWGNRDRDQRVDGGGDWRDWLGRGGRENGRGDRRDRPEGESADGRLSVWEGSRGRADGGGQRHGSASVDLEHSQAGAGAGGRGREGEALEGVGKVEKREDRGGGATRDGDDDAVTVELQEVSLKCPLSQRRIEKGKACKGFKCKHMQCFDGGAWNMFVKGASTIKALENAQKCPICGVVVGKLVGSEVFEGILAKAPAGVDCVTVDSLWNVLSVQKKRQAGEEEVLVGEPTLKRARVNDRPQGGDVIVID